MTPPWLGFVLLNLGHFSDAPVGEPPSPLVAAEQRVHAKGYLFAQNFGWVTERVVLGEISACTPSAAGAVQGDRVGSFPHAPTVQPRHQD